MPWFQSSQYKCCPPHREGGNDKAGGPGRSPPAGSKCDGYFEATAASDTRLLRECRGLVRLLPGEVTVLPAEVAIGRRLLEDRPPQIEALR